VLLLVAAEGYMLLSYDSINENLVLMKWLTVECNRSAVEVLITYGVKASRRSFTCLHGEIFRMYQMANLWRCVDAETGWPTYAGTWIL